MPNELETKTNAFEKYTPNKGEQRNADTKERQRNYCTKLIHEVKENFINLIIDELIEFSISKSF